MTMVDIGNASLWVRQVGDGPPVLQIHGAGFGHHNFAPVTPILAERFTVIDYDQRGYGGSDRPEPYPYCIESWADDAVRLLDALGIDVAHVHGTSMGGMVAQVVAGKYPERVGSVVINCAAAKLGARGRLTFQNWIDIVRLDPDAVASRTLAELITWTALSAAHLDGPAGATAVDQVQAILRDSNSPGPFVAACRAMQEMDLQEWVRRIQCPALVLGGDQDIMTPWDQGPGGAGQQWIADHLRHGETHVIVGGGHSTPFDSTAEHAEVVAAFFARHT
jgi:pimeloyl-ACP methyl ester carboxylesterase